MTDTQTRQVFRQNTPSQSKLLRVLATIVSYICHPVFMPTIMALVLYYLAPASFAGVAPHDFGKWMAIIILNTVGFPLISVGLLKALDFIPSIHMPTTKDRILPLMTSMIFYFWASHVFDNITSPFILKVLLLGSFYGVIMLFMINIFVKISMHAVAAGGMIGILIVLMIMSPVNMMLPLFIALIIAGIIGTARLILGAHTQAEIWLGYIIGILVQLAAYLYLKIALP